MKKPTTTEDVAMARIECDDLFGTVFGALKDYRCTHTFEEDGDGSRLVDLLSPGPTIKEGQEELELLAESIACEIADFIAGEISSQPNTKDMPPGRSA